MKTIQWNKPMLERFRKEYQRAVENNQEVFTFDGNEFLPDYAKYLIQYLDSQFGDSTWTTNTGWDND